MVRVAAVQATPVFLDREATTDKACALVKQAAAGGAQLVAFPEAFIPTYPDWVWRTTSWADGRYVRQLYANAVEVPGPVVDRFGEATAEAGVYAAVGVNEIEGGTLYNTLLYLGPDGQLVQKHRKLMPTGGERLVWGMGDGSGLGVLRAPFGVVGGPDLLGELHAAGAGRDVRAGGGHLPRPDVGQQRHLGLDTASHREGGRCHVVGVAPVPARLGRPAAICAAISTAVRTTGCRAGSARSWPPAARSSPGR